MKHPTDEDLSAGARNDRVRKSSDSHKGWYIGGGKDNQ